MKKKKWLALLLAVCMTISCIGGFAAFDLPDGGPETEEETSLSLIDFNSSAEIQKAGAIPKTEYATDGQYSVYWNHNVDPNLYFRSLPTTDFSDYYILNLSVFGKNTAGTSFVLVFVCSAGYYQSVIHMEEGWNHFELRFGDFNAASGAKWSDVSYMRFTATGWSQTPSYDAEYYISSAVIDKAGEGIEQLYGKTDIEHTYAALENGVAVYADSKQYLTSNQVKTYEGAQWRDDTVMIPTTLFASELGAKVHGEELSVRGETLTVTEGSADYTLNGKSGSFATAVYRDGGVLYVPAEEVGNLLGYQTKKENKLVLIGDEKIRNFDSESKANNMLEIAGYLAFHIDYTPADITKEDFDAVKEKWRYSLVADNQIDLSNQTLVKAIGQVADRGKASWDLMDKTNPDSLFLGKAPTTSANMTSEYNYILSMAKAWAQYGSRWYQNEDLKNDILYALEWQYQHRYGQAEIENKGWRDTTLTNWYDWQIAAPMNLVDSMMLMEEYLTPEQKENYLAFFEYWVHDRCYASMHADAGMNVLYTAKNWVGSCVLREDAEDAIDAVSCLHNTLSWADTFRTKEGFWTDGSYVFHYKHPMTGQYGIGQLQQTGPILSAIAGTRLDLKNPRRENVFNWLYDSFEPLIYNGEMFRMVKGRSANSSGRNVARQFVISMLNLMEFADAENMARMKSIIKYYVNTERIISYSDSTFTIPQLVLLNEILADESVEPRGDYIISKVYGSMDRVVHQRKNWALGISMSSSRIYDYECIHGENSTGWYTGEGMTQMMLENDQRQFHASYWNNVDPYKYPGITADTQQREPHTIDTGKAFVKDFDFVGGVNLDGEFSVAAQKFNAFHLDEDITQNTGNVIKAHKSTLVGQKAWFCFDDEVVCLGAGINAQDGFEVRTIVENRKSSKVVPTIPEEETTPKYEIVGVEASQEPQAENVKENTLDGDFGTKWAAEGASNITWDLGEVKTVGFVGLSFQNGNKRTQAIDLELSEDGTSWNKVFEGNSGGKTEGQELFDCKNTNARYVRMGSYGNSDGGAWVSLTTVSVYPPNPSGEIKVVEPLYLGAEIVTVDGTPIELKQGETELTGAAWVSLENTGGYYFPQGGRILAQKTNAANSFFELWLSHGESPKDAGYAYVLLPTMTAEQTQSYAQNPDIEILSNTDSLQAVRDKSTGITGVIFWEAGSFEGITVSDPMLVMYRETDGGLALSVSDPTQKLQEATVTINRPLRASELEWRFSYDETAQKLHVNFAKAYGASAAAVFQKGVQVADLDGIQFADKDGKAMTAIRREENVWLCAAIENRDAQEQVYSLRAGQYGENQALISVNSEDVVVAPQSRRQVSMPVAVLPETTLVKGFLWKDMQPVTASLPLPGLTEETKEIG